jgi:hypothetical protein
MFWEFSKLQLLETIAEHVQNKYPHAESAMMHLLLQNEIFWKRQKHDAFCNGLRETA